MANDRCVNPFVHRFRFRTIDYFQIIIGTILLVPMRIVLTVFLFMLASTIAKFANYLLDKWQLEKEAENKWRYYLRIPCVWTFRAMFFCSGFHRINIVDKAGPDAEKEARVLVVAPHTSPFDVLSGIALKIPSPVARHDAVDIPLFGNVIKITDPVFVERDSKTSRNNVLSSVLEKIKFVRIFFFPEGTCTNRRALCQFKAGAFKLGLPIQPIAIKYDQGGGPDTLSWTWDGPPVWKSIWLTLSRWSTGVELVLLPVYHPSEQELQDPELYAYNVSVLLARELGFANLYYSFDDVKYLHQSVFRSPICLKFLKLMDKIATELQKTGLRINNNFHSNGAANGIPNGVANGVSNGVNHAKNKKQMLIDTINETVNDKLEKIELNSSKDIKSIDDIISLFNLENYPVICGSMTVNELLHCLRHSSLKPNTTHIAVVLHLCDLRVQSFWQRLENGFNALAQNRDDGRSYVICNDSLRVLLWLALGIEKTVSDNKDDDDEMTFDAFREYLVKNYRDCIEENARELLTEPIVASGVPHKS